MGQNTAEIAGTSWPDDGIYRLFTAAYCGYCHAAVRALKQRDLPFEQYDVTINRAARKVLTERTGMRTIPQIWHGSHFVGGYTELSAYLDR